LKTLDYLQKYLKKAPTYKHWQNVGIKHHHGIALPLFSLRSKKSSGIGEFLDLFPIIDWVKTIGYDVIQLLPLNDTGEDPSPYNALSSQALDPMYLSLYALPLLSEHHDLERQLETFQALNNSQRIAYAKVKQNKMNFLHKYFEKVYATLSQADEYLEFTSSNVWLGTYALYRVLKEKGNNSSWKSWPEELQRPKDFHLLLQKYDQEVNFYIFLQYLAFSQFKKVKAYASSKNILIKGDIPILLSQDSADVWTHLDLFNGKNTVGAPPDAYNAKGQDWGFPMFQWKAHEKEHFSWWKQRLQTASQLYHLYRIDHVVGFFRFWVIPPHKKPVDGHFMPRNFYLWQRQGQKLLKMMIDASFILPMAEDLGTIPRFVPRTLKKLGICGTRVIRWARRWEEDSNYINVKDYEPLTMTTVSTHDAEPLSLWWEKYPIDAKLYAKHKKWKYTPVLTNQMRYAMLYDSHHSSSLFHINPLQEYLAFFPELIWPKPEDERINIPGTASPINWTYRFRPTVEEIISHENLQSTMQQLLL